MTELNMWQQIGVLAALGLGSWMLRASFIVAPAGRSAARYLERWLVYARPAIMAALVASVLIRTADAETAASATAFEAWLPLLAGLAGATVASRRWALSGGLVGGMLCYTLAGLVV